MPLMDSEPVDKRRSKRRARFASVEILRPLRNPHPFESYLGAKVITLATLLRRSVAVRYQRMFGMSGVESRAVLRIGTSGPLSLDELADHIAIGKSQTSRLVTTLTERKLVARERRQDNARTAAITLTSEGRALERRLKEVAAVRNHELTDGFDEQLLAQTSEMLDAMLQRARTLLKQDQEQASSIGDGKEKRASKSKPASRRATSAKGKSVRSGHNDFNLNQGSRQNKS